MRIDPRNILIVALLGCLTWQLVDGTAFGLPQDAQGGGGDAARDLIAVTGTFGSGASALYVIDTKTRHLAVYRLHNGRRLELVSARDCMYDFFIEPYNDGTPAGLLPKALRKGWRELNERGGETPKPEKGSEPDTAEKKGAGKDR
jgi:hypothetical protein